MEEWELTGQTKEEGDSELTEDEQAKGGSLSWRRTFFLCYKCVVYNVVAIFLGPK